MKIINGRIQQRTPIFESKLSYLIFNPWWEVPSGIAKNEMLPEIKKDIRYLNENHLKLYRAGIEQNPANINWDSIHSGNFHYKIRQTPGPWNALGRVKFIFPNKYDIYFHDTPQRELFESKVRTFSHGCIRVEKPIALASLLLNKNEERVIKTIDNNKTTLLSLPYTPMIYICYWTIWVNDSGELNCVPDIYGYDRELELMLNGDSSEHFKSLLVQFQEDL